MLVLNSKFGEIGLHPYLRFPFPFPFPFSISAPDRLEDCTINTDGEEGARYGSGSGSKLTSAANCQESDQRLLDMSERCRSFRLLFFFFLAFGRCWGCNVSKWLYVKTGCRVSPF
jgi:hypothetical protein